MNEKRQFPPRERRDLNNKGNRANYDMHNELLGVIMIPEYFPVPGRAYIGTVAGSPVRDMQRLIYLNAIRERSPVETGSGDRRR